MALKEVAVALVMMSFGTSLPLFAAETKAVSDIQKKAPLKINLNTASLDALTHAVKGIGVQKAKAIIAYREQHHGFKSIEELEQVRGLGKNFVKRHRDELIQVFVLS